MKNRLKVSAGAIVPAGADTASPARERPVQRLLLAGCADFWRLWSVGLVVFTVRWVETVAVGVFVYQHSRSAFLVAMMTMLRLLPMGLFGAFIGAWAEKVERRVVLIVVVVLMLATSASLALLDYSGHLAIWHLAAASFLNGLGWATDNPVRRVMIGEVVGGGQMSTAMSLDVGANNASRMVGPTVGGLLLASVGIGGAFMLSVALYSFALYAAFRVRYRNTALIGSAPVLARIAEGLRLVRGERRLIGTLAVTIIYNVFGWPFTSMVPVIGQSRLGLGAEGIGILASMDGVGAFFGALLLTVLLRPAWYGRAYLGGVAIYLAMLIVFALAPWAGIAGGALLLTGFGGAGFSTMQATLVYLAAPPEMRSRILGVLSMCIGAGPIGFVALGLLADAIGAPWATALSGSAGLLCLALTRPLWRHI
ncbi:MFS transporter [Rhodopila sp.]|uniref:MFS transporter n=1 Tax=Rhodopila sp. TaxID=2480087 RepID=UPI003D105873